MAKVSAFKQNKNPIPAFNPETKEPRDSEEFFSHTETVEKYEKVVREALGPNLMRAFCALCNLIGRLEKVEDRENRISKAKDAISQLEKAMDGYPILNDTEHSSLLRIKKGIEQLKCGLHSDSQIKSMQQVLESEGFVIVEKENGITAQKKTEGKQGFGKDLKVIVIEALYRQLLPGYTENSPNKSPQGVEICKIISCYLDTFIQGKSMDAKSNGFIHQTIKNYANSAEGKEFLAKLKI